MSTTSGYVPGSDVAGARRQAPPDAKGFGWMVFAGIILSINGVLNVIYGIAAIGNSKFFVNNTHYVLSNLNTWGWVALILGVLQVTAALSLFQGRAFGRIFAIGAASLTAIAALMSIPAYPLWSLAVFALSILIIYGCTAFDREAAGF